MGTDNLHHKRKARTANKQKRRDAQRSPYDRVLIVCEGEKTEPNYFKELIRCYGINSANVEVADSRGSSPKNVLESAEKLAKRASKEGNPYDRIYCVFDKDSHASYSATVEKLTNKQHFYACTSVPCFEYWLLLHFEYTTTPYHASGNRSICTQVIKKLKSHIPNYEKGNKKIFDDLETKLGTAIENAKKALSAANDIGEDNPTTHAHELVEYLINLKK
ncbi:RloB family protein [Alteromonas sp. a30]|uniref:RloB family protein n=1 Tax=Alteromonas sp. a30 TaxID=2730917 RepID=UPI00227E3F88|nr:RloB family protein [Alteromonas sp. a30]MCY7294609.1 RloB domain-containing protein [Alteromonas sp. a30]